VASGLLRPRPMISFAANRENSTFVTANTAPKLIARAAVNRPNARIRRESGLYLGSAIHRWPMNRDVAMDISVVPEVWQELVTLPGNGLLLHEIPTGSTRHVTDKKSARALLKHYRNEIDSLLRVLAEENQHSILLILQISSAIIFGVSLQRLPGGENSGYLTGRSTKIYLCPTFADRSPQKRWKAAFARSRIWSVSGPKMASPYESVSSR
jgi:hypothetical protein